MPKFTIECTYRLPVYRHRTYEAETVDAACALALADDDWESQKEDYETGGPTYVSGAWEGENAAYNGPSVNVPDGYAHEQATLADPVRDAAPEMLAALLLAEKHIGSLCEEVCETDLPDWFADLVTIRAAISAAGGTVANTGGDHTKSTFFDMLDALRGIVDAYGGDVPDWLVDKFAAAENAIAKAEGRANG